MANNQCGICSEEVKAGEEIAITSFTHESQGSPIIGHLDCFEGALKSETPKNPAKIVELE
jgi:hypothetical protein